MTDKRKKAIRRRRIFFAVCFVVLAVLIACIILLINVIKNTVNGKDDKKTVSSAYSEPSDVSSAESSSAEEFPTEPEYVQRGDYTLDANYSRMLLVNAENPLPENYDYGAGLTKIEDKYHNGQLDQIDEKVWPYMKAMIEAAWKDGVKLYVWSPYRSYDTQDMLFKKQVQRCLDKGTPADKAEEEAATVVARPGTSEHNTGLCADFNMASDAFENTPMFSWMKEHAAEYGFILRYPKESQDNTGVIYESWHWRFVGINMAARINETGLTLEEFVKTKKLDPQAELKSAE